METETKITVRELMLEVLDDAVDLVNDTRNRMQGKWPKHSDLDKAEALGSALGALYMLRGVLRGTPAQVLEDVVRGRCDNE